MSANTNPHPAPSETSGEQLFFVLAIAFLALVVVIVLGAFLPLAAGIGVTFVALAVSLAVVGRFLAHLLSE